MHNPALRAECAAVVDFFINATALIFRLLRAAAGLSVFAVVRKRQYFKHHGQSFRR